MTDLFEKSIRTLELPAVLEKLAAKAVSQAAKDRCLKLTPSTDAEEVLRLLDETDAAKERLGLYGSPSFSGVKDVSEPLARADRGGMLNTRELLDIAGVLTASRRVSDYDAQRQGEETVLDRLFASLHTNKYLEEQIRSAILDEETIADTASPELADIRRKMRAAATKGRQILQRIISSPSYAKVLQEALITQRDGRFVVPVKAECKGSLPGLVHDISSSGATLFSAIVVLTIMILPYIISVSATALRAVPREYEEASLALGANYTETWFRVSLRAAKSGVAAAVIQGVGRALGEAMAIIMVAGNVANMPGLFQSVRFLTTAIVSEMSYASYGSLQRQALFSIGLVLFLFIMMINWILHRVIRKEEQ